MNDTSSCNGWTLRDLPFAARLTIAVFLVSVGFGYFSALVNMHFQTATPGQAMPSNDDVLRDFVGKTNTSPFERLLVAHPSLPFNGQGSMRSVFTKQRAGGWGKMRVIRGAGLKPPIDKEAMMELPVKDPKLSKEIDQHVAKLIDGERIALIAWVRDGAPKEAYENDNFPLKGSLAELEVNPAVLVQGGPPNERAVMIKTIIDTRCARCHGDSVGGLGSQFPLEKYEDIILYTSAEKSTGKSLTKLAMTTHVHLLAFSMLYGMTGIIFALTGYWRSLRVVLAPLPLLAQLIDISFWWLARMDEPHGSMFALLIPVSGGVVALGLFLQIVLTLFSLFGKYGKAVLAGMILAVLITAFGVKDRVTQYLANEKTAAGIESIAKE